MTSSCRQRKDRLNPWKWRNGSVLEEREEERRWRKSAGGEEDGAMEQDIYSVCPEEYNGNLMRRTHKVRGLV